MNHPATPFGKNKIPGGPSSGKFRVDLIAAAACECFVFDRRVGVDPALRETDPVRCFNCQEPLTAAEQRDPRHVSGVSCPHRHAGQ